METIRKELESLPVSSMLKMEGKEYTVQATVTFQELYQGTGSSSWVRRGKQSKGIILTHNLLLVRIPSQEGGKYIWLRLSPQGEVSNLREFYKGGNSPGEWGPARRFAKQGQTGDVLYKLFETQWNVKDIGTFELSVNGESQWFKEGDRLYFVTSQRSDNSQWLLYLDARPGEAQGTGGAFLGEEINPEELVEEVL